MYFNKLQSLAAEMNLIPLFVGMDPVPMKPEVIPYMSEYWNKSHMLWLSKGMHMTTICFMDAEYKDEKAEDLLNKLQQPQVDDPDLDKIKVYSEIISTYPCYFATIVSYKNCAPNKGNRPSFEIACRANKVTIKSEEYKYYHKDV